MTQRSIASLAVGAALALSALAAHAAEPFVTTARAVHKPAKFEVILEDKAAGRLVYYSESTTNDKEVQGRGLWTGSSRIARGHWDLTHGAGTGRGSVSVDNAGSTLNVEWAGICYMVGDKPRCSGGWNAVPGSGTGKFAGLTGGGTWQGSPNAEGNFDEEWTGLLQQ
ncbi:MAG: hypothetical protein IT532_08595 [Burkholderiales bacterium]|nr:hypothetical protein [Burkholderiales bacterium]